jgi:hypothetical protein
MSATNHSWLGHLSRQLPLPPRVPLRTQASALSHVYSMNYGLPFLGTSQLPFNREVRRNGTRIVGQNNGGIGCPSTRLIRDQKASCNGACLPAVTLMLISPIPRFERSNP